VIQAARTPLGLASLWVLDAAGALRYRDAAKPDTEAAEVDAQIEIVTTGEPEASGQARPAAAAASARKPEKPASQPESQATSKLRDEIAAKHAQLAELNYYQLLNVAPDCDAAAIKHAYHVAAKVYHPDTLARSGLDAETRAQANRVFGEISKAHATLSDPNRRVQYDEERRGGGASGIDANRLANAETFYRKGEILMRQGNFRGAFEFLKPAVDLWPDECAYQSALGWVYYKKTPSDAELARQHLEKALALDAEDGVTLFRLGVVLRALGQTEAGAAAHERASRLGGREG
jgi:tetratricopeptide (TPR) repeat protein